MISYVLEMRMKLVDTLILVHEELDNSQRKMKTWYVAKARTREFKVVEEVLVLLQNSAKSLET